MQRSNRSVGQRPAVISIIVLLPVILATGALQTMLQSCQITKPSATTSSNTVVRPTSVPKSAATEKLTPEATVTNALSGKIHVKTRLTHGELTRTIGGSRLLSPMVPYLMGVLGEDIEFRATYSIEGPQDDLLTLKNPRLNGFKGVNIALPPKWQKHLNLPDGARIAAKTRWMVTRWTKAEHIPEGRNAVLYRGYYYEVMALIDVNIGNAFFYTFVSYESRKRLAVRCEAPGAKNVPRKSDTFDAPEIEDPMRAVKL